jgi:hypothetical protein
MGLIVKAGLDALGMKPMRVRHSALGRFPAIEVLAVIEEDEEPGSNPPGSNLDDLDSDEGDDLESNHSSDSDEADSNADPDEEDTEQEDEPENYRHRKKAYLLGDTYMKQLTKDVSLFPNLFYCLISSDCFYVAYPFEDGDCQQEVDSIKCTSCRFQSTTRTCKRSTSSWWFTASQGSPVRAWNSLGYPGRTLGTDVGGS